jgi:cobaltochelatase CobN
MKIIKYTITLFFILIAGTFKVDASAKILFLCSDNDSYIMTKAVEGMKLPDGIQFEYILQNAGKDSNIQQKIKDADLIIANCLIEEFREYIYTLADFSKTKVYVLSGVRLRGQYPVIDSPEVAKYRSSRGPENFRNMIYYIVNREFDGTVKYEKPVKLPAVGICHTATDEIFSDFESFLKWYKAAGKYRATEPVVAVTIYAATFTEEEMQSLRLLVNALEAAKLNTFIAFGDEPEVIEKVLLDNNGQARIDVVLGMSFKFRSGLRKELLQALEKLGVPVINGLKLYRQYTYEWQESAKGMNDFSVTFALIAPEISGLIEPALLFGKTKKLDPDTGKEYYVSEPFVENIRNTTARIKRSS